MSPQSAVPDACRPRRVLLSGRAKWAPALWRRLPLRLGAAHSPRPPWRKNTASLPPSHPVARTALQTAFVSHHQCPTASPAQTDQWVSQVLLGGHRLRAPGSASENRAARPGLGGASSGRLGRLRRSTWLARLLWAVGGRVEPTKMAVQVLQAVQAVHLESDAFLVCLNHALSTEKEEVMGLCIGEVSRSANLAETLLISSTQWYLKRLGGHRNAI